MNPEQSEQYVRLLAENTDRLERYIRTLLPDAQDVPDLMQEVAVALWQKFEQYDPTRPFLPWACRFAYYEAINYREKTARRRMVLDDDLIQKVADEYVNELDLLQARQQALNNCLEKMPVCDRKLLQSRYGPGETVRKLAQSRQVSIHKLYHDLDRIRGVVLQCVEKRLTKEGWHENV